jgi:tripeptidyl-peptidase I
VVKRSGVTKRSKFQRRDKHAPGRAAVSPDESSSHNVSHLPTDVQDCGSNITPPCIKYLYKIPQPRQTPDKVNSMGLYESGDTYAQGDLDLFFAQYAPYVPQGTHPIPAFIDSAEAPVLPDDPNNTGESDIDMDMAFSLIYPQTVTLYQTDDRVQTTEESSGSLEGFLNTFLDALDGSYCTYSAYGITGDSPGIDASYPDPAPGGYKGALQCGVYTPTRVISGSYGEAEADLPQNYQQRQCNEFMKLGLQGHSIFFSSGDYGVASYPGDISPSGCTGPDQTIFTPNYPVNCPYITAVGATRLYADQDVSYPESALQANLGPRAELFASAGGFANYFGTADYQKAAVDQYFAAHDPGYPYYVSDGDNIGVGGGIYNRAGRGYPDVSANGAEYRAYTNGTDYHYYGTSLAAPLWGSIMTLINEERTYYGKGPVGFVNPVLYRNPQVFNDIVNGSNPGCGSAGFHAVKGWDPITGLGTPNFRSLRDLYLGLP